MRPQRAWRASVPFIRKLEIDDGEEVALVELVGADADGRCAVLPWKLFRRLRRDLRTARFRVRRSELTGAAMVYAASRRAPRRRRSNAVELPHILARLVTHATPREVVTPLHEIEDLRPSSWRVRDTVTGQVRRGDHFGFGIPIAA